MTTSISDKIATIVPMAHLEFTADHARFMALVHLLKYDKYRFFFENRAEEGRYVILDNSTVELGEPWPMEDYVMEAMSIGANQILLPDWLNDSTGTLRDAESGLKLAEDLGYTGDIMGVPQGRTQEAWIECLEKMLGMGITSIGISRRYLDRFGQSRLFACYVVYHIAYTMSVDFTIHLLGAGLPPEIEVAPCLRLPRVVGVDSAMPSYFAKAKKRLRFNAVRPEVQRDIENDEYDEALLRDNIAWWRMLCQRQ